MNPVVLVYKWNSKNEFLFFKKIYIQIYEYIYTDKYKNKSLCMHGCVCVYPWYVDICI